MAIDKNIKKGTEEVADLFGAELVKRLQRALIDKKKLATGSLIGQMSYDVKSDSQGRAVVRLFAEDYFRYVDKGRGPGKQPPLEAIKAWTRVKFLPEKLAFPIARKIGREGIKGINIINPTLDNLVIEFSKEYEEELEQIVGAVLVNDIFSATTTKGQIIPKTLR
jgi:hypothetical protein